MTYLETVIIGTLYFLGFLTIAINVLILLCYIIDRAILIYKIRTDRSKLLKAISNTVYGVAAFVGLCFLLPVHIAIIIFATAHIYIGTCILPFFTGNGFFKFVNVLRRLQDFYNEKYQR